MPLPVPVLHELGESLDARAALVWALDRPMRSIASTALGGGLHTAGWVVNVEVDKDYSRHDNEDHLRELAAALGCAGTGVGFLTAAEVACVAHGTDGDVEAYATVGLRDPAWAAAHDDLRAEVGTINVVVGVPARCSDAALVNLVSTVTEAKVQALVEAGIAGTGTASDALCVLAATDGRVEQFGGPRSPVGARAARATHRAVTDGIVGWRERNSS